MMLPLYVLGYGIGRFLVESIRTDPATLILGIRVNHWVSGLAVVGALVVLAVLARRAEPGWYAVGGDGEQFADASADSAADPVLRLTTTSDDGSIAATQRAAVTTLSPQNWGDPTPFTSTTEQPISVFWTLP